MKEIVCDTNVFYRYKALYKPKYLNYLSSYYNFQDLLCSKSNLKGLDERISKTLRSKINLLIQRPILIHEPHYDLIKDVFPDSEDGVQLVERLNKNRVTSFINTLKFIAENKIEELPRIKISIVRHTTEFQKQKEINTREIKEYANNLFNKLGYKNRSEVKYTDLIEFVEDQLIQNLNSYAEEYMVDVGKIDRSNINLKKYELFILVYAKYLSTLIGPENETPALNDNIDTIILLYANSGRKFMTLENKWLKIIKEVGLHKKYLVIHSNNWFDYIWKNLINLKIFGRIITNESSI